MQIPRYLSDIIIDYLAQFPAVFVLGARQVGKTTLCHSLTEDWLKLDLEEESDRLLLTRDPSFFLTQHPEKVLFDEAQACPELFPALRVAIDRDRQQKGRFLLTGSSSPHLLQQISETLAGRVGIVELPTLKASELFGQKISSLYTMLGKQVCSEELLDIKTQLSSKQLEHFFLCGGFPELALLEDKQQRQRWFQSYVASYIERDIRRLFPRLQIESYKLFVSMLAQLQGKLINMSDISRSLGVSQPTVREYLEIAHRTFVWRRINAFTRHSVRRIVKMPKGLYRDSGLVNHLLFIWQAHLLQSSPLVGWLWEAMIIEEILKGLALSSVIVEPFFYRTSDGREVDLILEGEFGLLPIEIKYGQSLRSEDLKPIQTFIKEFKLPLGIVISNNDKARMIDDRLIELPATFV